MVPPLIIWLLVIDMIIWGATYSAMSRKDNQVARYLALFLFLGHGLSLLGAVSLSPGT
jgi:hypothetical protein